MQEEDGIFKVERVVEMRMKVSLKLSELTVDTKHIIIYNYV